MTSLIRENTVLIGKFLSEKVNVEDPVGVVEKLRDAVSLLGTSSYNTAQCEMELVKARGILAEEYKSYSTTTAKNIIEGKLFEQIYYKTLCESQDKQLHYMCEALRTIISYLKTEINSVRN